MRPVGVPFYLNYPGLPVAKWRPAFLEMYTSVLLKLSKGFIVEYTSPAGLVLLAKPG